MGSKNDIELGVLPPFFKHYFKTTFDSKVVKITKRKKNKIVKDRPLLRTIFNKLNFQEIMNSTIAISKNEEENVYDCLSTIVLFTKDKNGKIVERHKKVIYHIIPGKKFSSVKTIYITNEKQIRKDFDESMNLVILKKEEFTTN